MLFSEIPGLDEVKKTLINSVKSNHVHHAQLFMGTEGSANLAMAIAYATYINCEEKKEDDSCGTCPSCIKFKKLAHPDINFVFPISTTKNIPKDPMSSLFMKEWRTFVLENPYGNLNDWANHIGAENKQLNISVEESRNIIKTLSLKAFEAEYKILFIWQPENLHTSAANALLKILEEPPVKTVFLLVANNLEKILGTIQSRTQKVKIRSFTDDELKKGLVSKFQMEEKKASQLAYMADGNFNEALRLDQEAEEDHHVFFRDWMRICYKKNNWPELIEWSENFQKLGREMQKSLLQYGLNMLRETLVYSYAGDKLVRLQNEDLKFVQGFSKVLNEPKVEAIAEQLNQAHYHIERNANPKITFLDVSLYISGVLKS
ncbi:MAG: DNA polymerase III subunit delta [Cytophagaceae bacterium]|nr:DNA polymerase III subunit delta [Cytophagaceae bacterium]